MSGYDLTKGRCDMVPDHYGSSNCESTVVL